MSEETPARGARAPIRSSPPGSQTRAACSPAVAILCLRDRGHPDDRELVPGGVNRCLSDRDRASPSRDDFPARFGVCAGRKPGARVSARTRAGSHKSGRVPGAVRGLLQRSFRLSQAVDPLAQHDQGDRPGRLAVSQGDPGGRGMAVSWRALSRLLPRGRAAHAQEAGNVAAAAGVAPRLARRPRDSLSRRFCAHREHDLPGIHAARY